MHIITLDNLYSTIDDVSGAVFRELKNDLSVMTPGYEHIPSYKKGFWNGKVNFWTYNKDTKVFTFPTGLLSIVAKVLKECGEEYHITDSRKPMNVSTPDEIKLKHKELESITLRDYQYDSVAQGLKSTRGVINVATNGGKTEIACGLIQQILKDTPPDKRIVFFTHSKEIFAQSKLRIEERLGMKVGTIGNGKWDEHRVMVVMIPTLSRYLELPKKLPKSKRLTELTEQFELMKSAWKADKSFKDAKEKARLELKAYEEEQWGTIKEKVSRVEEFLSSTVAFIADEAHHSSADTWYNLFMKMDNAYFRFGLTGTVDRSNPLNVMRLFASTGKIVKEVSNDYLISKGYSAKPTIYMLELQGVKPVFSRNYMEVRKEGIITCSLRNRIFAGKVQERVNSGKQCLIIVNETEHGEIVHSLLRDKGFTVEFTHGDKSNKYREQVLEDLKSGQLRVLIATTILDEGVDVSGINCLFLMAGGKSMRQVLQRIGRGLRKKADGSGLEVYDSLDYHNEYLTEHTLDRYTTYKEEGFDIVKVSRK